MTTNTKPRVLRHLALLCALLMLPAAGFAQGITTSEAHSEAAPVASAPYTHPLGVPASSARQMAGAAQALLEGLTEEQRTTVRFDLQDSARANWSNLPASMVERDGLRVGDLTDGQRILLHDLIRASMSGQGYQKVAGVIRLEALLHEDAAAAVASGERQLPPGLLESWTPENYWFSVFGEPGRDADWGWLLSGHHVGASFTVSGDRVGFTPLFLGAEPDVVRAGPYAGWQVLSHEAERGHELLQTLTEEQRRRVVLSPDVPDDVLSGPGRQAALASYEGAPASAFSEAQQALLWVLVEEYVMNADHDAGEAQLAKIRADGLDALYFAWRGPVDDADGPYYYRIHGPSVLIEYAILEGVGGSAANHVHSIVRDPSNDYGEDWLGRHYEEHHRE